MKNNNMEIITSYLEGRKAISITVATQSQHIRRIIPLDKAVRIREGFDEAISEADKLGSINKQTK